MKVFKQMIPSSAASCGQEWLFVQIDGLNSEQLCDLTYVLLSLKDIESDICSGIHLAADAIRMFVDRRALPMFLPARCGETGTCVQNSLLATLQPEQRQVYLHACELDAKVLEMSFPSGVKSLDLDPLGIGSCVRVNTETVRARDLIDPDSVLAWWLDYGDPDQTFIIQKNFDLVFPDRPFFLYGIFCETGFSEDELIPVI